MANEKMKLDEIIDSEERFSEIVIAFTENKISKDEFIEICRKIFNHLDRSNIYKTSQSYLRLIIEHLLLLQYRVEEESRNFLLWEIVEFRRSLRCDLLWGRKNQETNLIDHLKDSLPAIYLYGIDAYRERATVSRIKTPKLKKILVALPKECPWTLEELLESRVADLILELPEI